MHRLTILIDVTEVFYVDNDLIIHLADYARSNSVTGYIGREDSSHLDFTIEGEDDAIRKLIDETKRYIPPHAITLQDPIAIRRQEWSVVYIMAAINDDNEVVVPQDQPPQTSSSDDSPPRSYSPSPTPTPTPSRSPSPPTPTR